jgi:hypothetical protein
MAQNATLDGTSDRGGWTSGDTGTSNIHTWADTTTAGDDYIQGVVDAMEGSPVGPAIFTLSNVTDPETASNHKIKYTAISVEGGMGGMGGGGPGLTIALFEGTTQRHTTTNNSVDSSSATAYTITLSDAEANSITDYDNLLLRVTTASSTGDDAIYVFVMYLEVPDASAGGGAATTSPAFLLFME